MAEESPKSVHFNNTIKVVLIPKAVEYYNAKIHKDVWYSYDEMIGFRDNFVKECAKLSILSKNPLPKNLMTKNLMTKNLMFQG